jgi:predicted RNA-binding Zn-ribbon protein involved in translation (DUF1610 family)
MSKFKIVLMIAVLMSFLFISCSSSRHSVTQSTNKSYYTCPMHSEVIAMQPGKCPKCGMALVIFDLNERIQRNSGSSHSGHNNSGVSSGGCH